MMDAGDTSPAPQVDAERPWPGLLAFAERDRDFFFGREAEAEELAGLVANYRLTTLYSLSGLGKTSLLHAGLFPRLRDRDFLPVYLRFNTEPGAPSPTSQIKNALADACRRQSIDARPPRADETAWQYLHRPQTELWSPRHRLLTPVLVLDQFEEIFSHVAGDSAGLELRGLVVETIGDLAEGRVPIAVKSLLEREPGLATDLLFAEHRYRVLIVMREDYLADLEELATEMPSLRRSRMRLTPMRGATAAHAVLSAGRIAGIVTPEVAFRIVESVGQSALTARGTYSLPHLPIEPFLLSVVCRELNEERIRRARPQITADQVDSSEAILLRLYEEGVRNAPEELRQFIEDRLVTIDGVRELVAYQTIAAVAGATEDHIRGLIENRILRIEYRDGRRLVELTHDRLGPVVRESRLTRERRQAEERRQRRERAAAEARFEQSGEPASDVRQVAAFLEGLRTLGSRRVLDEVPDAGDRLGDRGLWRRAWFRVAGE